jgi:hypothetical protein
MFSLKNSLFIVLVLIFSSCKKEPLPVNETKQPEFYFNAEINGASTSVKAGDENYFMHASHYFDTNNVYVLKAELSQNKCQTSCGYALTLLINDSKTSAPGSSLNVSEALHNGKYIFNDAGLPPLYYEVLLKPVRNESPSENYRWQIKGQQFDSYTANVIVKTGERFVTSLNFQDSEGTCSASHQNQFVAGKRLQANITVQKEATPEVLMYSFSPVVSGLPPYRYQWQFGDGNSTSESENPFHTYQNQGFYTAKLTVIDSRNDTCISQYQIPAFEDPRCEANFTAKFNPIPNSRAFSAITVLLTDPNGKVFSSKTLVQPESSNFEVLEVADYQMNDSNEPTKKIKVRFNCVLQNGAEQIKISNAEAVMAISY